MKHRRSWRNILYTAWDILWIKADFATSTFRSILSLRLQGCPVGKNFNTSGRCSFKARSTGSIQIGENARFLAGWRCNRVGLSSPVLLQTFGDGQIDIGDFSGGSAVVLSSRSGITVGKHVNLGGNVRIYDHDFHALDHEKRRLAMSEQAAYIRSSPIEIGDDVFVGANAMILKGVKIGARTIVAAGAVVFKGEYPSDCILAGNPAVITSKK